MPNIIQLNRVISCQPTKCMPHTLGLTPSSFTFYFYSTLIDVDEKLISWKFQLPTTFYFPVAAFHYLGRAPTVHTHTHTHTEADAATIAARPEKREQMLFFRNNRDSWEWDLQLGIWKCLFKKKNRFLFAMLSFCSNTSCDIIDRSVYVAESYATNPPHCRKEKCGKIELKDVVFHKKTILVRVYFENLWLRKVTEWVECSPSENNCLS